MDFILVKKGAWLVNFRGGMFETLKAKFERRLGGGGGSCENEHESSNGIGEETSFFLSAYTILYLTTGNTTSSIKRLHLKVRAEYAMHEPKAPYLLFPGLYCSSINVLTVSLN